MNPDCALSVPTDILGKAFSVEEKTSGERKKKAVQISRLLL